MKKSKEIFKVSLQWRCLDCGTLNKTTHGLPDLTLKEDMHVFAGCKGSCIGTKSIRIKAEMQENRMEMDDAKALHLVKYTKTLADRYNATMPPHEWEGLEAIQTQLELGKSVSDLSYGEYKYLAFRYKEMYPEPPQKPETSDIRSGL
jgi:hypothetical protein